MQYFNIRILWVFISPIKDSRFSPTFAGVPLFKLISGYLLLGSRGFNKEDESHSPAPTSTNYFNGSKPQMDKAWRRH